MMRGISVIHEEIIRVLKARSSSYANPVSSEQIGFELNVTPSYVREQAHFLQQKKLIGVRRGRGGGYYLRDGGKVEASSRRARMEERG